MNDEIKNFSNMDDKKSLKHEEDHGQSLRR